MNLVKTHVICSNFLVCTRNCRLKHPHLDWEKSKLFYCKAEDNFRSCSPYIKELSGYYNTYIKNRKLNE